MSVIFSIRIFIKRFTYINLFQDDGVNNILNEIIKTDQLSLLENEMKSEAEKSILSAAKLIAPVIEDTLTAGFSW